MKRLCRTTLLLCATTLIAACTADGTDEATNDHVPVMFALDESQAPEPGDGGTTRAGFEGEMTAQAIRSTGFGVYARMTGGSGFNFMSNQYVGWAGSWSYHPVKYWPNQSSDHVSFFAYAPHVDNSDAPYTDAATALSRCVADGHYGILSLPAAAATGDPKIAYRVAANPAESVDLMFGVAAHAYDATTAALGTSATTVAAGMPFLNMTRQLANSPLAFRFAHALAGLTVYVTAEALDAIDWSRTRILIEDISLGTAGQQLYTRGILNLNNTTPFQPLWESLDGAVSSLADAIDVRLRYDAGATFGAQPAGLQLQTRPIFGQGFDGSDARLFYIPGPAVSGGVVTMTVTYHIMKADGTDRTLVSTAAPDFSFAPGHTVALNLHLPIPTSPSFGDNVGRVLNGGELTVTTTP